MNPLSFLSSIKVNDVINVDDVFQLRLNEMGSLVGIKLRQFGVNYHVWDF
jgi:hypothetical protein